MPSTVTGFLNEHYCKVDRRWLGIFRIGFGCLLISELCDRWSYRGFSTLGLLPTAFALSFLVFACFTVGYRTRLFQVLSAALITVLYSRGPFTDHGGAVATHALVMGTLFLPLGQCFSIDAVRRSLRAEQETSAAALNERGPRDVAPLFSIVVLGLLLLWSALSLFDYVQSHGAGWRNHSARGWLLDQERLATSFGGWWARAALIVEGALGLSLLVPSSQRWMRRVAFLLALGLHGIIALLARVGPLSHVMVTFFLMLFGPEELDWLGRWFGRKARKVTVIFDADCGICLFTCRLLKRLDPWQALHFVGNHETEQLPAHLDPKRCETTVVVVDQAGQLFFEERAVRRLLRALPLGVVLAAWLYVPGLSHLGRAAYRAVARNRVAISAFFGLGVCGIGRVSPSSQGALPR